MQPHKNDCTSLGPRQHTIITHHMHHLKQNTKAYRLSSGKDNLRFSHVKCFSRYNNNNNNNKYIYITYKVVKSVLPG